MNNINRDPGLAAVFSFIFSGLGQIYNGQIKKGLSIIFLSSLCLIIFIIGGVAIGYYLVYGADIKFLTFGLAACLISLFFICIIGIYSIMNAYKFNTK